MDEIYGIILEATVSQFKWTTILLTTLGYGVVIGLILHILDDKHKFYFMVGSIVGVFLLWSFYIRWYLAFLPTLYIISCICYFITTIQLDRAKKLYDAKREIAREEYEGRAYDHSEQENGMSLQTYRGNINIEYEYLKKLNEINNDELIKLKERKDVFLMVAVVLFYSLLFTMLGFEHADYLIPMEETDLWKRKYF